MKAAKLSRIEYQIYFFIFEILQAFSITTLIFLVSFLVYSSFWSRVSCRSKFKLIFDANQSIWSFANFWVELQKFLSSKNRSGPKNVAELTRSGWKLEFVSRDFMFSTASEPIVKFTSACRSKMNKNFGLVAFCPKSFWQMRNSFHEKIAGSFSKWMKYEFFFCSPKHLPENAFLRRNNYLVCLFTHFKIF